MESGHPKKSMSLHSLSAPDSEELAAKLRIKIDGFDYLNPRMYGCIFSELLAIIEAHGKRIQVLERTEDGEA